MKNNIFQTIAIIFFLSSSFLSANDDLEFKSKSLEILKNNNEIHAKNGVEVTDNHGLEIFGDSGNLQETRRNIRTIQRYIFNRQK